MSDFTKATDFAAKDALLTGNPAKLVKGTEIDAEFNAIATAISTKYDATDVGVALQAYDAFLTSIAALGTAADKMIYTTASNTAAESAITAAGRAILDDATASDQLTTLGVSAFAKTVLDDATASDALTTLGVSAFAKTVLDDATASDALTTLGAAPLASFLNSLVPNGYQKLAGGLIIQWGTVRDIAYNATNLTFSFPIAFPTDCLGIISKGYAAVATTVFTDANIETFNASGVTKYSASTNQGSGTINFRWMAIGY